MLPYKRLGGVTTYYWEIIVLSSTLLALFTGLSFNELSRSDLKSDLLNPCNFIGYCGDQINASLDSIPTKHVDLFSSSDSFQNPPELAYVLMIDRTKSAKIDSILIEPKRKKMLEMMGQFTSINEEMRKKSYMDILPAWILFNMHKHKPFHGSQVSLGYYNTHNQPIEIVTPAGGKQDCWETIDTDIPNRIGKLISSSSNTNNLKNQKTDFGYWIQEIQEKLLQPNADCNDTLKNTPVCLILVTDLIHDHDSSAISLQGQIASLKKDCNLHSVKVLQSQFYLQNRIDEKDIKRIEYIKQMFESYFSDSFSEYNVFHDQMMLEEDSEASLIEFLTPIHAEDSIFFYHPKTTGLNLAGLKSRISISSDQSEVSASMRTLYHSHDLPSMSIYRLPESNGRNSIKILGNGKSECFNVQDTAHFECVLDHFKPNQTQNNLLFDLYNPKTGYKKRLRIGFIESMNIQFAQVITVVLWILCWSITGWSSIVFLVTVLYSPIDTKKLKPWLTRILNRIQRFINSPSRLIKLMLLLYLLLALAAFYFLRKWLTPHPSTSWYIVIFSALIWIFSIPYLFSRFQTEVSIIHHSLKHKSQTHNQIDTTSS